jgi:hypothetical protein
MTCNVIQNICWNIVTERTAYVLELIYFTIRCFCTDNCELSQKLSWSQMYPLRKDDILSSLRWEALWAFYGLPGRFQSGRRGLKPPTPVMISVRKNVMTYEEKFSLLPYFLRLHCEQKGFYIRRIRIFLGQVMNYKQTFFWNLYNSAWAHLTYLFNPIVGCKS